MFAKTMFRWFQSIGYDVDLKALECRWQVRVTSFDQWVDRNLMRISPGRMHART
jgi:hypothetical protein